MLSKEIMYQALLDKNSTYEGIFIVAVKTTGIFCRPTCTARKPKFENVEYYETCKEALQNGFRPCKICSPLEESGKTPEFIKEILSEINFEPSVKLKDYDLRKKGYDPATIRRWFKKHHGMSFHAYQRMLRLNSAFGKIQAGEKVTHAAFDTGFESLSGFGDSFKAIIGDAPSKSKSKQIITIDRFSTPLGPMYACCTEHGICMLEFTDRRAAESEFKELVKHFNAVILPGEHSHLKSLKKQLSDYFTGKLKAFDIAIDAPGTAFQKQVWEHLQKIQYGETVSYKEMAKRIGNPDAVRAVGNANGHNRISIVLPCHRVIGENGTLTGYGGGLSRKKWLLDFEKGNK